MEEKAKQGGKQGAVSPLTGAPVPAAQTWKPGQSGNPAGSSAKARARAALERLFDERAAGDHFEKLLKVASDPDHPHYAQVVSKLHAVLGLTETQAQQIVLSTKLELEDRRDGAEPARVMISQQSQSQARAIDGEGASVEVEA